MFSASGSGLFAGAVCLIIPVRCQCSCFALTSRKDGVIARAVTVVYNRRKTREIAIRLHCSAPKNKICFSHLQFPQWRSTAHLSRNTRRGKSRDSVSDTRGDGRDGIDGSE